MIFTILILWAIVLVAFGFILLNSPIIVETMDTPLTERNTLWFKLREKLFKFKENCINAYYIVLSKIIPCKLLTIRYKCPLEECETTCNCAMIIFNDKTSVFQLDEILDAIDKSTARHLEAEHRIKYHEGLEFTLNGNVYTFMKRRYVDPMKLEGDSDVQQKS